MADEHDHCERVGHNVMCNSISSLDDPDDYCREIGPWIEEHNLTVLARQTLDAGLEPNDERLLTPTLEAIRDYEPGQADCGFLNMLDTVVDRINDILDLETPVPYYQPTGIDPRISFYSAAPMPTALEQMIFGDRRTRRGLPTMTTSMSLIIGP